MIRQCEGSWRQGSASAARGPMGPGCCLKMAAAMRNQTCRYCNSELPGNNRQLVLYWSSAISLLTVVGRSGGESHALGDG